ncbi:SdrD B-like domain-containing protein, partial [Brevibacterium sp.]|uniref:SdrD B-like domain-containing protein n=1 Tax=Brevibacterium sp. TaxID=1701 RepID=UPI00281195D0
MEKVNFDGVCKGTDEVTLTFDKTVTDPILDVSGLGGYIWARAQDEDTGKWYARGGFLQQQWTVDTAGVTIQKAEGTSPTDLDITSTGFKPSSRNAGGFCDTGSQDAQGTDYQTPQTDTAGCGSVVLRGTFDTVKFRVDNDVAPFSAFPQSSHGTGDLYFQDDDSQWADGINGLNSTYGESPKLPYNTWQVQNDQAHYSVRVPQTGVIGDRVWQDANRDGIQDEGESGIEGATVELLTENGEPVLDADGNPITTTSDSNGAYKFDNLPLGKYKVRFSNVPDGSTPTVSGAGDDAAKDSDIDSSGVTGVIDLNTDVPTTDSVDAGFAPAEVAPKAADDTSDGNKIGDPTTVPVLDNDSEGLDPTTVNITDPGGNPVKELTVDGEGKWTVGDDGKITFTPADGFDGNPTPIDYTVEDKDGQQTGAKVTITYLPEATDDESLNNKRGTAVTVPTLGNDKGDLDPTTVNITDPNGNPVKELTVDGEGKWTVDPNTGDITFTPADGFNGNPTPIDYTVKDTNGNDTGAKVTITYVDAPKAADDTSDGNKIGDPTTVPVLDNDSEGLDPTTVNITDPGG